MIKVPIDVNNESKIPCICDRCEKEFCRKWVSLKKNLNEVLCNSCLQKKRYDDPTERKRQSSIVKEAYKDPKNRERLSKGVRSRFEDLTEREKISITQKERYKNSEVRKKNSKSVKLAWDSNLKYRKKQKESLHKYFLLPEAREKASKASLLRWQNVDYRKRMIPIVIKNRLVKNKFNSREKQVFDIIKDYGFKFVGSGENTEQIAGFCPDFINKSKKLIIEFNGCYWHKCKECFPSEFNDIHSFIPRDLAKLHAYPREGYGVLFIWEHELENQNGLIRKIEKFVVSPDLVKTEIMRS